MLRSVRKAIGPRHDTIVFFEMPNALFTLRDLSIWDIIYEHCSYFSAGSLAYAFRDSSFDIIEQNEEFGGQFLSITARPTPAAPATQPHWQGIDQMARDVAAFAEHYRQKVSDWTARLEQMEQAGKKVVVWGAGSKGVMFMNTLNTQERISYVVDINPRKQGMHVAGSGQQIVSPAFLGDYQPDTIILMNPIYRDEVGRIAAEHGVTAELVSV
jgi:hypothetical protein